MVMSSLPDTYYSSRSCNAPLTQDISPLPARTKPLVLRIYLPVHNSRYGYQHTSCPLTLNTSLNQSLSHLPPKQPPHPISKPAHNLRSTLFHIALDDHLQTRLRVLHQRHIPALPLCTLTNHKGEIVRADSHPSVWWFGTVLVDS